MVNIQKKQNNNSFLIQISQNVRIQTSFWWDENKAICISSQPGKPKQRLTKHEHLNARVKYEKAYLKWFYSTCALNMFSFLLRIE